MICKIDTNHFQHYGPFFQVTSTDYVGLSGDIRLKTIDIWYVVVMFLGYSGTVETVFIMFRISVGRP